MPCLNQLYRNSATPRMSVIVGLPKFFDSQQVLNGVFGTGVHVQLRLPKLEVGVIDANSRAVAGPRAFGGYWVARAGPGLRRSGLSPLHPLTHQSSC